MPTINVNGIDVAYRDQGDGPLAIAVHASSSHSGQWKPYAEALSDRCRIVAPDLHGYGRTPPYARDGRAWFQHDALILEALIGQADGPVHLVGHSLGGALCLMAATIDPRVASVWVYEPVLFALLDETGSDLASEGWWISSRIQSAMRLGRINEAAAEFVDFWAGKGAWDATPPSVRDYILETLPRVADDWAGALPGLPGQMTMARARALSVPVRLVTGAETRPSAKGIAACLCEANPRIEHQVLPDLGHMGPVAHPEKVLPSLLDWLTDQVSTAT